MGDATVILSAIEAGDPSAADQLLPLVYAELRKLAAQRISREQPGQPLQSSDLVHEAFLRLVDTEKVQHWSSRRHFFAAAAEAMRRILIEQARRNQTQRRGGGLRRHSGDQVEIASPDRSREIFALTEVLDRFEKVDPIKAELVKLRFFAGLTASEAAEALDISKATADRNWAYARAWLHAELTQAEKQRGDRGCSLESG
ncbi:MAG TPA: ECF-type sigma factor [Planctomycetaceae bacterium]|nr:ECF-type sigma factor [Planctomycetaceae bacterium]